MTVEASRRGAYVLAIRNVSDVASSEHRNENRKLSCIAMWCRSWRTGGGFDNLIGDLWYTLCNEPLSADMFRRWRLVFGIYIAFYREFVCKVPDKMIKSAYDILDLQTYITAGEKEVKAWTIKKGTKAPAAAGVIHTDFEKGFIKAEVVSYEDFISAGSWASAREKGLARLEGKDYVVQDGDIMVFRFNN